MRFADSVVLLFGGGLTDGAHSNGSAAALAYAREGAQVIVVDRVERAATDTVEQIIDEGASAIAVTADVTSEADVARVVRDAVARFGRIDVLHNNVGATRMGLPPELDLEEWNASLAVNVGSVFLTCKYVLPVMVAQQRGAIVNISSLASLRDTGYPYPAYSAAKAAVNQLTVTLAPQYARHGIRVNAVAPGVIHTPLIYRDISAQYESIDDMIRARDAMTPTGKMGTPWDVAEASLFLRGPRPANRPIAPRDKR